MQDDDLPVIILSANPGNLIMLVIGLIRGFEETREARVAFCS